MIFAYLLPMSLWYCTGNELSQYVRARDFSEVAILDHKNFQILIKDPQIEGSTLSLKLSGGYHHVVQPDGSMVPVVAEVADIHVMVGIYTVKVEG